LLTYADVARLRRVSMTMPDGLLVDKARQLGLPPAADDHAARCMECRSEKELRHCQFADKPRGNPDVNPLPRAYLCKTCANQQGNYRQVMSFVDAGRRMSFSALASMPRAVLLCVRTKSNRRMQKRRTSVVWKRLADPHLLPTSSSATTAERYRNERKMAGEFCGVKWEEEAKGNEKEEQEEEEASGASETPARA
jgi:hypothetical protein